MLNLSNMVDVTVNLTPASPSLSTAQTLLIVTADSVIDVDERIKFYTSISEVADDFATDSEEYLKAEIAFAQGIDRLAIGRFADVNTSAVLKCGDLSVAEQVIALWQAITDGAFKLSIDGVERSFSTLDFHSCANLNAVATVIDTAITTYADCAWNGSKFIVTAKSTGASSAIGYMVAPSAGTDISTLLKGDSDNARAIQGMDAETQVEAIAAIKLANNDWYSHIWAYDFDDAEILELAAWTEADMTKQYGVGVSDTDVPESGSSDIGSLILAAGYKRTHVFYNEDPNSIAAPLGYASNWNPDEEDSHFTLKYKVFSGVTASNLSETQRTNLIAKRVNFYASYGNTRSLKSYQNLTCYAEGYNSAAGIFYDLIQGIDAYKADIQASCIGVLSTALRKVPQTDLGMGLLLGAGERSSQKFVTNGFLAPGKWNSAGIGEVESGNFLVKGYYIYAQSIRDQAQADRDLRKAPPITVLAKSGGAIHSADITINIER